MDSSLANVKFDGFVASKHGLNSGSKLRGNWRVQCVGADGVEKWSEEYHNIIVDAGLTHTLATELGAQTQVTAWYVGLKGTGTVVAGDILSSHAGWAEINPYTGNRKAFTAGTAAAKSIDNSGSPASFAITAALTVYGAFLCSAASGTSGTLFAAGDFASSRAVVIGDTLNVTATFTQADDGV